MSEFTKLEIQEMVDSRIERFADKELDKLLELMFYSKLAPLLDRLNKVEQVVAMVKWLALAVATLLVGTIYQLLVGLVGAQG
ncbi:hypothetical protein [Dietzia sp. MNB45]|uniref:hypothetical protein n=1 Tax=Dietzia sp. MNB45 TaxID=3238800 RepID=UPI003F80D19F